jgi:hypothetical protein
MPLFVVIIGKDDGTTDYKIFRNLEDAQARFRGALGAWLRDDDLTPDGGEPFGVVTAKIYAADLIMFARCVLSLKQKVPFCLTTSIGIMIKRFRTVFRYDPFRPNRTTAVGPRPPVPQRFWHSLSLSSSH